MVTRAELFQNGVSTLKNNIDSYKYDATQIFVSVFGNNNVFSEINVSDSQKTEFLDKISRRSHHEPLQYILGEWDFYGLNFYTDRNVLIPREETEIIVDEALKLIGNNSYTVFDICCGSGCIGISIAKNSQANVSLYDISPFALDLSRKNAKKNGVSVSIDYLDILNGNLDKKANIIVCNPPYLTEKEMNELQIEVRFEPKLALFGGNDGLDFYRALSKKCKRNLDDDGYLILEIGDGMSDKVKELFLSNGFIFVKDITDFNGIIRTLIFKI